MLGLLVATAGEPRRLGQPALRRLSALVEHLRQTQPVHDRPKKNACSASGTTTTTPCKRYYGMLDHIDWVAYYKNHGYQINAGCCGGGAAAAAAIQFAPVFVSPTMQWAVPNSCLNGPPCGPRRAPWDDGPSLTAGQPGFA